MSTSKGSSNRNRAQKHQNRTSFRNNLHDTSKKTKFINSLNISEVCARCKDIIEWKIKYKKYKTLTTPKKCVNCEGKTVKHAYHVMCKTCAKSKNACPKCCKNVEVIVPTEISDNQQDEIQSIMKILPERKRRTLLRYLNKNQDELKKPNSETGENELSKKLDELKMKLNNANLDESDSSSDDEDFDLSESISNSD